MVIKPCPDNACLERETHRNVELMCLTGRLFSDFKTIADLRKNNGKAIRRVRQEFITLCCQPNYFTQAILAIEGSKFNAVNNRDENLTQAKMKWRIEEVEKSIERHLGQLGSADRENQSIAELKMARL